MLKRLIITIIIIISIDIYNKKRIPKNAKKMCIRDRYNPVIAQTRRANTDFSIIKTFSNNKYLFLYNFRRVALLADLSVRLMVPHIRLSLIHI